VFPDKYSEYMLDITPRVAFLDRHFSELLTKNISLLKFITNYDNISTNCHIIFDVHMRDCNGSSRFFEIISTHFHFNYQFLNNIDETIVDCTNREYNLALGCLPINGVDSLIRLERDLNHFKYTICPMNVTANNTYFILVQDKCLSKFSPNCEIQTFQTFNNYR